MADFAIACDLNAIPSDQREHHGSLAREILASVEETAELPDGYGLRLPFTVWEKLAEWLPLERLCCPFFTFTLEVMPGSGSIWLRLTGGEGVKEFIGEEFSLG